MTQRLQRRRRAGLEGGAVPTMHLGPREVLRNLSLDFRDDLSARDIEAAITRLERRIHAAFPDVTRIFIGAEETRRRPRRAH